jgi:hypothetical protein
VALNLDPTQAFATQIMGDTMIIIECNANRKCNIMKQGRSAASISSDYEGSAWE